MSSLRTRVLVSVLALAAAGMVALGALTYAEQRSFLTGRVDQQVHAALGALSFLLDQAGFLPPGQRTGPGTGPPPSGFPFGAPGGPADGGQRVNLPPGTFGQRRDASGKLVGHSLSIRYGAGESSPSTPRIPAHVPLQTYFTVGSAGASDLQYRVYAQRDPEDSGVTVAAVPLSDVEQTLHRLLLVEGLVIAGVLLALGLSAFFVVKLGLRPLDRIELTAGQIAAGDLSRRVSPATTRTEIGRLGLALNAMLERLEQAFAARMASEERLRRFLSDASHELRTPLASIRGYAELFRMGAASDEAGTAMAMRRIEQESARMGILVEDLLILARLDEAPEREATLVDLSALARDAVQDASATAPERAIALDAPTPVIVHGDPLQFRQVLSNLLRNALVHTPQATAVEVAVKREGDSARLVVRDHGPGIPAEALDHLFERFWRKEGGRERGRAGAGLGLAIVHGVVSAHGGTVTAQDAPGGGAQFAVELPIAADLHS